MLFFSSLFRRRRRSSLLSFLFSQDIYPFGVDFQLPEDSE